MSRCAIRDIPRELGIVQLVLIGNIVVDRRVALVRMHVARQDKIYTVLQEYWFEDILAFSPDSWWFVLVADVLRPVALDNYPRAS